MTRVGQATQGALWAARARAQLGEAWALRCGASRSRAQQPRRRPRPAA